jgi:hypothetical protein
MAMDKSLSMKIENAGGATRASLAGDITEDSEFGPVMNGNADTLILDLGDIRRINSTGVREWIKFVTGVHKAGRKLVLERCSVAIVQQLNMISNFRGSGHVRSILAPYYCENCDAGHLHLVDLEQGTPELEMSLPCPKCKQPMEFDEVWESYLAFRDY